jgi:hypothetical protein
VSLFVESTRKQKDAGRHAAHISFVGARPFLVQNEQHNLGLLPRGTLNDFWTVALFGVFIGIFTMANLPISSKSAYKIELKGMIPEDPLLYTLFPASCRVRTNKCVYSPSMEQTHDIARFLESLPNDQG